MVALNPYPGHEVVKSECINHAHKRMGTALRKLSSQGKVGGKGVGKLTAKKCKTLQNYYRGAILNNQGSIDQMKVEIWAGLLHGMSTDDSPLHTGCNPPGVGIGKQRIMGKHLVGTNYMLQTF